MPKKLKVKLTLNDFLNLAGAMRGLSSNYPDEFDDEVVRGLYMSLDTDEERYEAYKKMMAYDGRSWEYIDISHRTSDKSAVDLMNKFLPVEIRNASDINIIQDYIDKNGDSLNFQQKAMLISRAESINKQLEIEELFHATENNLRKDANSENPFSVRPKVKTAQNYILLDVDKDPRKKTSKNGCWAVCFDSMLRSRGIKGVTQEHIRDCRPKLGNDTTKFYNNSYSADNIFNRDKAPNILELADNALAFAPNTMIRSYEIKDFDNASFSMKGERLNEYNKNRARYKKRYIDNAIIQLKNKIFEVLEKDKCPLAISSGSHYITIVGMNGDELLYLETNNSGTNVRSQSFSKYIKMIMGEKNPKPAQLVWMSDIKLSKDNATLYNVPSTHLKVNKDGTLKLPPQAIYEDGMVEQSASATAGITVRMVGGIDDSFDDKFERDVFDKNGLYVTELAYIPKKLNIKSLRKDMKTRSNEEEKALLERTIRLVGKDTTLPRKKIQDDFNYRSSGLSLENDTQNKIIIEKKDGTITKDDSDISKKVRLEMDIPGQIQRYVDKLIKAKSTKPYEEFTKIIVNSYKRIKSGNATVAEKEGFNKYLKEMDYDAKFNLFYDLCSNYVEALKKAGKLASDEESDIKKSESKYGFSNYEFKSYKSLAKNISNYSVKALFLDKSSNVAILCNLLKDHFQPEFNYEEKCNSIVTTRSADNPEYLALYNRGKDILSAKLPEHITHAPDAIDKVNKKITFQVDSDVLRAEMQQEYRLNTYKALEGEQLVNAGFIFKNTEGYGIPELAILIATKNLQQITPINDDTIKSDDDVIARETSKLEMIQSLMSDPHLYGFLKTKNLNNFKNLKTDEIVNQWNEFKTDVDTKINRIFEDDAPALMIIGRKDTKYTIDELRTIFKSQFAHKKESTDALSYPDNINEASKIILLGILSGPGAKRMFFGKGMNSRNDLKSDDNLIPDEEGKYSKAEVIKSINRLRKKIICDPAFVMTLAENPSRHNFYNMYKENKKRKLDKLISEGNANAENIVMSEEMNKTSEVLSGEDIEYFVRTKAELDTLYKNNGKYRSEYMQNIYETLTSIITLYRAQIENPLDDTKNELSKNLYKLRAESLAYYKKRKGIIFNPVTNRGKQRLELAENLAAKTDKLIQMAKPKSPVK